MVPRTWKGGTQIDRAQGDAGSASPTIRVPREKADSLGAFHAVPTAPIKPFSFDPRRIRINWRLLHSLDLGRLVPPTPMTAMELNAFTERLHIPESEKRSKHTFFALKNTLSAWHELHHVSWKRIGELGGSITPCDFS